MDSGSTFACNGALRFRASRLRLPIGDWRSTAMHDTPDDPLPASALSASETRGAIGWDVLALLTAAGSASAAALYDAALGPLLIIVGLACLIRLERIWRP